MFNQLYDISETMERIIFLWSRPVCPNSTAIYTRQVQDEFLSHPKLSGMSVGVCEFDKPEKKKIESINKRARATRLFSTIIAARWNMDKGKKIDMIVLSILLHRSPFFIDTCPL